MSRELAEAIAPPAVVELDLGSGRNCIAEYHWVSPTAPAVVLLHDEEADLDAMRPLARTLAQQGLSVLNLDLPGHGLSSGEYARDSSLAIAAAALFAEPTAERGVALVAVGATSAHLLAAPITAPLSFVLIDPREIPHELAAGGVWMTTPSLFIVDPLDAEAESATAALAAQLRAWNVRCFVHRDSDIAPHTRALHIHALSTKFLLEQGAYRQSRTSQPKDRA